MNPESETPETYSGALDRPDLRDFRAEHVLGAAEMAGLPDAVDLRPIAAKNQGSTNRCTAYALTHVHEILQFIEHQKKIVLDAEQQWRNQLRDPGTATEKDGDYLQSALQSLRKFGLDDAAGRKYPIRGYAALERKVDDLRGRLAASFPIYTGSLVTKTNFDKAKKTGVWGGNDGPQVGGHAFAIVGYDDAAGVFIALNSYGPSWGKFGDGTFRIRYADVAELFTPYVLYDAADIVRIFRDVTEKSPMVDAIRWARDAGIVRGYGDAPAAEDRDFRPDAPITRAEMVQVLHNFAAKFGLK